MTPDRGGLRRAPMGRSARDPGHASVPHHAMLRSFAGSHAPIPLCSRSPGRSNLVVRTPPFAQSNRPTSRRWVWRRGDLRDLRSRPSAGSMQCGCALSRRLASDPMTSVGRTPTARLPKPPSRFCRSTRARCPHRWAVPKSRGDSTPRVDLSLKLMGAQMTRNVRTRLAVRLCRPTPGCRTCRRVSRPPRRPQVFRCYSIGWPTCRMQTTGMRPAPGGIGGHRRVLRNRLGLCPGRCRFAKHPGHYPIHSTGPAQPRRDPDGLHHGARSYLTPLAPEPDAHTIVITTARTGRMS